jgi:hypothetical protein
LTSKTGHAKTDCMAETSKTPPFLAWGLYREHRKSGTAAVEWRELGPVFLHSDGSGGIGHFKSIPTGGWNHRFAFRRYGEGPPPLPVTRPAPKQQQQQPTGEADDDEANGLFDDEQPD